MKIMGQPPPGAKIIAGAPPPGFKMVHSIPAGAASPVLNSTPKSVSRDNISPNSMGIPTKVPIKMLPPGAKLISGLPPPGSRPISPEGAQQGATNPSLTPSRSVSPTNPPVFRILPNGVKVLVSPPRSGASVSAVRTLPGHPSASPPKMLIKSMGDSSSSGGAAVAPTLRTTVPLIPPQNESFAVGPQASPPLHPGLPKPDPLRPGGTIVKVGETPARAQSEQHQETSAAAVHRGDGQVGMQRSQVDEISFHDENGTGGSRDDEIQFEEMAPSIPPQIPRASAAAEVIPGTSSSSSSSFDLREDPDEVTALPPLKVTEGSATPTAAASPFSSLSAGEAAASEELEQRLHKHGLKESSKGSRKNKRRSHRAPPQDTVDDGKPSHKERREHRHRHHRSRSSETGHASRRSASLQSYSRPGASMSTSPPVVDGTLRRSPSQRAVASGNSDHVDTPEKVVMDQLRKDAFTPQALTSISRDRIAENFLSILCPQQYYGKVQRISRIRAFKADRAAAIGLRNSNSIYVATKGVMPNPYFYPQLRLRNTDGERLRSLSDADNVVEGAVSTPIILYEAAPGNMVFADTELDARHLLESNGNVNSCFMVSNSAILFRNPEHYVVPIAALNVHWVPYTSPQSEPQCPIHKRELQLFDRCSKELVCVLCASRNGISVENFVVIPDVLGNVDSRRTIEQKMSIQLEEVQQSSKRWVVQHQRVRELCESKKQAIHHQFDLLIEALEAKRKEYTESCEAEFAYALTDVAREILITDEKVELLRAATEHVRTDPSKPLFSMQIATIAEGLSAASDLPSRFTRASLKLPPMSAGLVPNLEGVMSQVLALSPQLASSGGAGGESRMESRLLTHSTPHNGRRLMEDAVNIGNKDRWHSSWTGATSPPASAKSLRRSSRFASSTTSPRPVLSGPVARREYTSGASASLHTRSAARATSPTRFATDSVSVPNSTGTSLFDFALHDLLSSFGTPHAKRRPPRYVQWAIRVENPGDWVGLGVGVGSTIDAWEQGSTNDLSHLWIVPVAMMGQVVYLRVAVNASSGHAKLTVHDARGKQLDAGEVPHWNAARPSYPQATFGGHIGTVRMIEIPHLVH
nr:unnamed protein product [Leishmania braziliensis]